MFQNDGVIDVHINIQFKTLIAFTDASPCNYFLRTCSFSLFNRNVLYIILFGVFRDSLSKEKNDLRIFYSLPDSTPLSEEYSDSIRMLVLLENGEQRLITFTLPKEACTIQEILEQVSVPFQSNTNIQVTEANSNGINYIVTVGNVPPIVYEVSVYI